MPGKFIVLEGLDSEFIADQARRLGEWLHSESLPVVVTREPTDGPIGAQIYLALNGRLRVDELTLAALFLADRMDHLYREDDGILNELKRDRFVVCVRYLLSAYAYQSEVAELKWLQQINQFCPWPDLMIFIDLSVQSCLERAVRLEGYDAKRADTQKAELTRRRHNYLRTIEQCEQNGCKVIVIDGNQPADAIHRACRNLVEQLALR